MHSTIKQIKKTQQNAFPYNVLPTTRNMPIFTNEGYVELHENSQPNPRILQVGLVVHYVYITIVLDVPMSWFESSYGVRHNLHLRRWCTRFDIVGECIQLQGWDDNYSKLYTNLYTHLSLCQANQAHYITHTRCSFGRSFLVPTFTTECQNQIVIHSSSPSEKGAGLNQICSAEQTETISINSYICVESIHH